MLSLPAVPAHTATREEKTVGPQKVCLPLFPWLPHGRVLMVCSPRKKQTLEHYRCGYVFI